MGAPNFTYLFNTGSDILRTTDETIYPVNDVISESAARVGISIDVLGVNVKPMPSDGDILSSPDISPSVSRDYTTLIPKDDNGNYIQGNYSITERIVNSDTALRSIASIDDAADELEITSHGLFQTQPVIYNSDTSDATPLVSGTTYYVIVVDNDTIQLALTEADAASGTQIDITGIGSGNQDLTPAQQPIEVTYDFEYIFNDATQCIETSYDCLKPEFVVVDNTNYAVEGVEPTSTASNLFTVKFPVATEPDFSTNEARFSLNRFYTQTQTVIHTTNLTYVFTDYSVQASKTVSIPVDVVCDKSLCNAFKCVDNLYDKWEKARKTNSREFGQLNDEWTQVGTIMSQIRAAYDCNETAKVDDYIATLNDITGCSGCCGGDCGGSDCGCDDCSGGGEPILVVGAGGIPNLTVKKLIVTAASDITEYTWSTLIGLSYTNGDFNVYIDSAEADSSIGYAVTFDTSTGKVTFGGIVFTGTKFKFDIK